LVVGRVSGISYFENTGTASTPSFMLTAGAESPFSSLDSALAGVSAAPALADWDADGDLDLLVASYFGLSAYENTGSATAASFTPLVAGHPFDGIFSSDAIAPVPAFADMDGDDDVDLVVSQRFGPMAYFENIGGTTSPAYASAGARNPFQMLLGHFGSPALGDADGDGDADLVVSSYHPEVSNPAQVQFFESTPGATRVNLTEVHEVFDGQFSIYTSVTAPALGDLDGDGDQDLLLFVNAEIVDEVLVRGFRYYEAVENPVIYKPTNSVPGYHLAKEDIASVFSVANGSAISVADPNADGSDLQVTLSVDQGQLTLGTTNGLNFAFADAQGTGAGDGLDDATLTFRGTLAEINTALDGLTFRPSVDFSGVATLTITTNDLGQPGGGPAYSDTDSVPITVRSVATQVEQLQLEVRLLVDYIGLNRGVAEALQRLLTLSGDPDADANRIHRFMKLVGVFAHAGILTDEGLNLALLDLARDILTGIETHA
jgi:hypothetical protein